MINEPLDYARLCDGLVVLSDEDGVLLAGGPERQLLSGAAVSSIVEKLLPLLDGRHTVAGIASAMGITSAQARQAVTLLGRAGVLERGLREPLAAPDQVGMFLSRNVNATRAFHNSAQQRAALASSSVLVVAPESIADAILADLGATGVGQVHALSDPGSEDIRSVGLVAALDDPSLRLDALERLCRRNRVPLLRFAHSGGCLEIGPLFYGDDTACYACFAAGYRSYDWPERTGRAGTLLAGLVTAEIVATVARVTTPSCFRSLVMVSLPDLTRHTLAVTPMPGCPVCATPAAMGNAAAERAGWHEWLAERRPAELRTPRSTLEQDRPEERAQADPPEYTTCPRLPLPDDSTLSRLLTRLRDHTNAIDCFVLVEQGHCGDLPGNVFRYHPVTHQLIAVRSDVPGLRSCLAGTDLAASAMALVFVGVPARLLNRHRFSAYRHTLLAAGRAVAGLLATASDVGLTVSLASTWDDRLVELLELREQEVITAVAGLHPREDMP